MSDVLTIDCVSGRAARRALSSSEHHRRDTDEAHSANREAQRQARKQQANELVQRLAETVGVSARDLTAALRDAD